MTGAYARLDLERSAQLAKVEFRGLPANFGTPTWNTLPALRLLTAAKLRYVRLPYPASIPVFWTWRRTVSSEIN